MEIVILPYDFSQPDDLIAEFSLLTTDGVAHSLDEGGQEQINQQRDPTHDQPASALRRGDIARQGIGRVLELGGRDYLATVLGAGLCPRAGQRCAGTLLPSRHFVNHPD